MNEYINGAIIEAIEKAETLKTKIPGASELNVYFEQLSTKAESDLDLVISKLHGLLENSTFNKPDTLRQKFLDFKIYSGFLTILENVVVTAISRSSSREEAYVNKLVEATCKEINYPLRKPVVSCLSQQRYYHIFPGYNLLCVPLLESDFLLHLPDIFHELGHPLIEIDNRKVKGFQDHLGQFLVESREYFDSSIEKITRGQQREHVLGYFRTWKDNWIERWGIEFFCDLFAIYTLGPAFAWSSLHLAVKQSADIFDIPFSELTAHPPEDARMRTMLKGLSLIGFESDAVQIESKWDEFKSIVVHKPSQYYYSALPDHLIESACQLALDATKSINCKIASAEKSQTITSLLNDAWDEFWKDPVQFAQWEKSQVQALYTKWKI
jgi:hypothetical protein